MSDFRERPESGLSWWNTGSSSLGNMMINWETEHLLGTITNNLETSILNLKYKFELGNLTFECFSIGHSCFQISICCYFVSGYIFEIGNIINLETLSI